MQGNLVDSADWIEKAGAFIDDKKINIPDEQEYRNLMLDKTRTVYKDDFGTYTTDPSKSIKSLSIDEDTGDVVIKAPQALMNTDAFKQMFTDNAALKQLSQAYKYGGLKYKMPDPQDDTKEITVSELIDRYNQGLSEYINRAAALGKERENYLMAYGDKANNLSDEDIVIASNSAIDVGDVKVSSTTRQVIPDLVLNNSQIGAAIKNLATYDEATHSVERGDFFDNWYNLSNLNREKLAVLMGSVSSTIKYGDWKNYIDEETGEEVRGSTDAARSISFMRFMQNAAPDGDFWQQFGAVVDAAYNDFVISFGTTFLSGTANALSFLGNEGLSDYLTDAKQTLDWFDETYSYTSDVAKTIGGIARFGGMIAGYAAEMYTLKGVGRVAGKAASALSATTAGAKMANALSTGTKALFTMVPAAQKVNAAVNAIKTSKFIQSVAGSKLAGTALEFVTDTIMDMVMTDPNAYRTVFGKLDGESQEYIKEQFFQNAMGWTVFRGGGAALKVAGKTKLGQVANIGVSKLIMKAEFKASDASNWIKQKFLNKTAIESVQEKLDDLAKKNQVGSRKYSRLAKKELILEQKSILRNMKEDFVDTSYGGLFNASNLKKATESLNKIKAFDNAITTFNKAVALNAAAMDNAKINFDTAKANDDITEWIDEVAKLQDKTKGLTFGDNHVLISKEFSNYMGLKHQINVMNSIAEVGGPNAAKAVKAAELMQERIDIIAGQLGRETTELLDRGVELYKASYDAMNGYAKANGLLNTIRQNELENSEVFSETGYIKTRRVEESNIRISQKDGTTARKAEIDQYELQYSADRDFVDPETVRQQYKTEIATVQQTQNILRTGLSSDGVSRKVVISKADVEYARKITDAKKSFSTTVSNLVHKSTESTQGLSEVIVDTPTVEFKRAAKLNAINDMDGADIAIVMDGMGLENGLIPGRLRKPLEGMSADEKEELWQGFRDGLNKNAKAFIGRQKINNADDLYAVLKQSGADFEVKLNKAYLKGDESFVNSSTVDKLVAREKVTRQELFNATYVNDVKSDLGEITNKLPDNSIEKIDAYNDELIDSTSSMAVADGATKKIGDTIGEEGGVSGDEASEYLVLKEMSKNSNKEAAYRQIDNQIDNVYGDSDISPNDMKRLKEQAHDMYDRKLESRLYAREYSLMEQGSPLADGGDLFDKVKDIQKQIDSALDADNIVEYLDPQTGELSFVEVDPNLASLIKRKRDLSVKDAGIVAKLNYTMSRAFRFGTTTFNLTSMGNQLFKDTGNAVMVGGALESLQKSIDNLEDIWGKEVCEYMKKFNPYEYTQIEKIAAETGKSMATTYAERELAIGATKAGLTTEVQLYKDTMETIYSGNATESAMRKINKSVDNIMSKIDDKTNGIREEYLRKRVYLNNFNDGLQRGLTNNQSRDWAEFAMHNATTNFSRSLYHLQSIAESTPYFSAAINGAKSFWRMFEMDPVGITGRMFGGLALPTMYLVGQSLADDENRKVYERLPEYQKESNLSFVINGEVFQIPMPEQMRFFASQYRHLVESMYNEDRYSFSQLMMNDLLGLSPINLQGFSDVDMDKMSGDPTVFDRLGRGFSRMFSQIAPVPIKAGYMLKTGIDPYTGKNIQNPTYTFYNPDTGEVEVMDYTQNEFAKLVAGWFGDGNAALVEKVLSSIIGNTGTDILGFIGALGKAASEDDYGFADAMAYGLDKTAQRATAPFTTETYDLVNSEWRREVNRLEAQKDSILNSDEYKKLDQQIGQVTDPEKKARLLAQRQSMFEEFHQKVKTTVENLTNKYNGTFDRYKFASVMALLNFNNDITGYTQSNAVSEAARTEKFFEGRESAIRTMQELGITGTTDLSIFGYIGKDADGNAVIKYSTPTAILDAANTVWSAKQINLANIEKLVKSNSLGDAKAAANAQISAIYDKGKLSQKDYDRIDEIKMSYNDEAIAAILPYVRRMSPEAIYKDDAIVKYLEGYIMVPSAYEKVNNRYVSSGGGKLDKNMAFIQSYLEKVLTKLNEAQ